MASGAPPQIFDGYSNAQLAKASPRGLIVGYCIVIVLVFGIAALIG